ncbi:MAG TPA: GntR family transcriptional regulator [Mycobacteriales bacterium]|nr:GntR family transcriptional regulator [Mycobacteriales bacterium]
MKSAARVAREIEADISGRGWPAGEVLGSEAVLMDRYAVGRGTVREAVRILEDRQLVRPREGRSGGLVITAPGIEGVAAAVRVFLWHGQVRPEHLHELWSALLATAVGDLARSMDAGAAAVVAELRAGIADQPAAAHWSPVGLHAAILRCWENPPAVLVLHAALASWQPAVTGRNAVRRARGAHDRLLRAIARGDVAAAHAEVHDFFTSYPPAELGELDLGVETNRDPQPGRQKLGRRVAEGMLREIRSRGWPVGELLGTERDLQMRLGVSRAALREGVRLLESWSAVEARRGNRGGLVIVAPDPTALRDAARAWLDHAGTSRQAIFAVRAPLEVLAVRGLLTAASPDAVARLRQVLVAEERTGPAFVTGGPDAQRPSLSTEIARLSGNPALALFVPVLVDLVRARGLQVRQPEAGARWVAHQHRALVAAIEQRDAERAELLTRRYIAAVEQVAPADRPMAGIN